MKMVLFVFMIKKLSVISIIFGVECLLFKQSTFSKAMQYGQDEEKASFMIGELF